MVDLAGDPGAELVNVSFALDSLTSEVQESLHRASGHIGGHELVEQVGLGQQARPGVGCPGEHRRLGLAHLLVTGRPIWVLDEPTVSLDQNSVQQFADNVKAHLAAGGMALLATHIDLGLDAPTLDVSPYKADPDVALGGFEEAFL